MLCVMAGRWLLAAVVVVIFGMMLLLIAVEDIHGDSLGGRLTVNIAWHWAHARKETMYRAGILGVDSSGSVRLPGLLARTELYEGTDAAQRPFGLVFSPSQRTYSVIIASSPSGEDLVDQDQIDLWVSRWGQFQASMADEPGLSAFSVTVETSPATDTQLRQEITSNISPDAQKFSVAVLYDILRSYPKGSVSVKAYTTLTYNDAQRKGGRRRRKKEMIADLASRLPHLTRSLEATGAGACSPLSAQDICELTRVAYDPAASDLIDEAHAMGQQVTLDWKNCGPMAAQNNWDYYRHDSGISVTWEMTGAPRGVVQSSILNRLLAPQNDVLRKRVTWLFRPISSARTPEIVERDSHTAEWSVNSQSKPSARAVGRLRAARQTAMEEAGGAGLVNFSALVTVTLSEQQSRADAMNAVDNLAASARIRLRPVYGSQSSAFAAALPLGLNLRRHMMVPAEFTDKL
ncbi:hypothetical protein CRD59_06670 [Bifidobacterium xylocopae]|uniref:PrgI family protein n=2 Tax=Bifidobacterium xylocopae TaxID=2493119 RepID=A0A366KBE4_9BIFI|nr:hypothetical protein CRD59_06670 [Bifidobacterium xylocopae]